MNAIRKCQCHDGWDWGVALPVSGIYADIVLEGHGPALVEHLYARQRHAPGRCLVTAVAEVTATAAAREVLVFAFNGETREVGAALAPGANKVECEFTVENPDLWFPAGQGRQPLYPLSVCGAGQKLERKIGLRELQVVNEPDEFGRSLFVRVNGVDVYAKGADWIPADALPARQTPEAVGRLLDSVVQANMNMLRVWGGGQYEHDFFYDLCDEKGILLWQDCMFACAVYPATPDFLANVATELDYQVPRLRHHPSLALWCGDNECLEALGWYEESRKKRNFFVVNYDRLNRMLAQKIRALDPDHAFWPGSPSDGQDEFGDVRHADNAGDMHYWDVWFGNKTFDAYYAIQPRFCSEFGYQAFPSEALVNSFTAPEDRNVFSPVMDAHQKCPLGNAPIIAMFAKYFRMPSTFAGFLYLSQVQQALAIKTGVEY